MKVNLLVPPSPFRMLLAVLCLTGSLAHAQVTTTRVYVGSQGNFSDANGSITLYDPVTGETTPEAIPNLNTLIQSMTIHNGLGYITANISDRIDVVDLSTNSRISQIIQVPSPRYMAFASDQKAYVSNLYSATITILNLEDNCPEDTIQVGQNPEDIAIVAGRVYVANHEFGAGTTLTVIDVATDEPIETLDVGCDGPRSLEVDYDEELWVFCTGKTVFNEDFTEIVEETNGQVIILDGATGDEVDRFELDAQLGAASGGQDAFYDPTTREVYAVQGSSILVFDTRANATLDPIAIPGDESIGAVAYDPGEDLFYLGRVTGFTTAGFVSLHGRDGMESARFTAGIAPTSIALLQMGTPVAVERAGIPEGYVLHQNYPNPFNPSTTIAFEVPEATTASLRIYNSLGQLVAILREGGLAPGTHEFRWEARGMPAGLYLYRLETESYSASRRLTLVP